MLGTNLDIERHEWWNIFYDAPFGVYEHGLANMAAWMDCSTPIRMDGDGFLGRGLGWIWL